MTEFNFEESVKRLDEIVNVMESGSLGLDANLKLYEEGILLVKNCLDKLEQAKGKVTQLKVNFDGSSSEEDMK